MDSGMGWADGLKFISPFEKFVLVMIGNSTGDTAGITYGQMDSFAEDDCVMSRERFDRIIVSLLKKGLLKLSRRPLGFDGEMGVSLALWVDPRLWNEAKGNPKKLAAIERDHAALWEQEAAAQFARAVNKLREEKQNGAN